MTILISFQLFRFSFEARWYISPIDTHNRIMVGATVSLQRSEILGDSRRFPEIPIDSRKISRTSVVEKILCLTVVFKTKQHCLLSKHQSPCIYYNTPVWTYCQYTTHLSVKVTVSGPQATAHQRVENHDGGSRQCVDTNHHDHVVNLTHHVTGPDFCTMDTVTAKLLCHHLKYRGKHPVTLKHDYLTVVFRLYT